MNITNGERLKQINEKSTDFLPVDSSWQLTQNDVEWLKAQVKQDGSTLTSDLVLKKEMYEVKSEFAGIYYATQYTNGVYTVFVNEVGDVTYANVKREDMSYPSISSFGINIAATGSLTVDELDKHIEKVRFAKDTHDQILAMFEGIRIK